jgi:hypothetical protein
MGHNPRVDLCPESIKKIKKKKKLRDFGEIGFGKNGEKVGKMGCLVAGGGWKWPAVVRWVVGR